MLANRTFFGPDRGIFRFFFGQVFLLCSNRQS
jgi:hypothetical protein